MKEVKYEMEQATSMGKDRSQPICFNSRSKAPYDTFSNFYEVKIEMPEGCFNSVEHYFQSMKFIDENHSRFEINGDLGRQGTTTGTWKPTVSKGRFIKSAGSKSGTQKYGLTLRSDGLDRDRAKRKMKEGLRRKFEKVPFKTLLLNTLDRPLVHTPLRGRTDDWTGKVDKTSGNIVGKNHMGKLLMEVRKEMQELSERGQSEESERKDDGNGTKSEASEHEIANEHTECVLEPVGDDEGNRVEKRKRDDSEKDKGGETAAKESEEPKKKTKEIKMNSNDHKKLTTRTEQTIVRLSRQILEIGNWSTLCYF